VCSSQAGAGIWPLPGEVLPPARHDPQHRETDTNWPRPIKTPKISGLITGLGWGIKGEEFPQRIGPAYTASVIHDRRRLWMAAHIRTCYSPSLLSLSENSLEGATSTRLPASLTKWSAVKNQHLLLQRARISKPHPLMVLAARPITHPTFQGLGENDAPSSSGKPPNGSNDLERCKRSRLKDAAEADRIFHNPDG